MFERIKDFITFMKVCYMVIVIDCYYRYALSHPKHKDSKAAIKTIETYYKKLGIED